MDELKDAGVEPCGRSGRSQQRHARSSGENPEKSKSVHVSTSFARRMGGQNSSDGTPRDPMDNTKLRSMGWSPRITLEDGIRTVYQDVVRAGHFAS